MFDHLFCVVPQSENLILGTEDQRPCSENCTSVYYEATSTLAELPSSLTIDIGTNLLPNITPSYNRSQEALFRNRERYVRKFQKLIENYEQANKTLVSYQAAPIWETFQILRDRMTKFVPCYGEIISNNDYNRFFWAYEKGLPDLDLGDAVVYEKEFIAKLLPKEDAIAVSNSLYTKEVIDLTREVLDRGMIEILGRLDPEGFDSDVVLTGGGPSGANPFDQYKHFNQLLSKYENRETRKDEFAEILKKDELLVYADNFKDRFKDEILDEMRDFLSPFFNEEESLWQASQMLALNASEWTDGDWKAMSYLISVWAMSSMSENTCDFMEFQYMQKYYNLEESFEGETFNCTVDLSFDLRQFLEDLTTCFSNETKHNIRENLQDILFEHLSNYERAASEIILDAKSHLEELWHFDQNFFKTNFVGVQIFFNDMSKQILVQEAAYDIWSLFCDIGGTMGLFIGASVITFCEIFDLIIVDITKRWNKEEGKEKKHGSSAIPASTINVATVDGFMMQNSTDLKDELKRCAAKNQLNL